MMGLGRSLQRSKEFDEKEDLWRRALRVFKKNEGNASPSSWVLSRDLADLLLRRGKTDEALRLYREIYDACLETHGESNTWTMYAEGHLLAGLRAAGRHGEARDYVRDHLADLRRRAEADDAGPEALNEYAWELLTCWPPDLRDPEAALPVAEKAIRAVPPEDSSLLLDTLARGCRMTGNLPRAIEVQRQAVALLESRNTPNAETLVLGLVRYLTLAGDLDGAKAETLLQVRSMRQQADREQVDIAEDLRDFGESLVDEGLWAAAEAVLLEAVELHEGMSEPNADDQVQALVFLCGALAAQGKQVEANSRLAQAERLVIEAHGKASLEYAENVLYPVGRRFAWCDQGQEAVALFRRVAETCTPLGEAGINRCRLAELRLGTELAHLGATEEAVQIGQDQIRYWKEARGENYWATGEAKMILGLAHLRGGNLQSAETELRDALRTMQNNLEERDNPAGYAGFQTTLAECLTRSGRFTEAESLLLNAHELVREYGKNRPRLQRYNFQSLVRLYEAWGKPAEAARWRE